MTTAGEGACAPRRLLAPGEMRRTLRHLTPWAQRHGRATALDALHQRTAPAAACGIAWVSFDIALPGATAASPFATRRP